MAETRPWVASYVSLAQFRVVKSLQIMELPEPKRYFGNFGSPDLEPVDPMERDEAVWGDMAYAFSEPVIPPTTTPTTRPPKFSPRRFERPAATASATRVGSVRAIHSHSLIWTPPFLSTVDCAR